MHDPAPVLSDSRRANLGARTIFEGFCSYHDRFRATTRHAAAHWHAREWGALQDAARHRLELYGRIVDVIEREVRMLLEDRVEDRMLWAAMKAVYSGCVADRDDWEIAETFFNSITRRVFTTVGVDPRVEFVDSDYDVPPTPAKQPVYRRYGRMAGTGMLVEALLDDAPLEEPIANRAVAVGIVAERIDEMLAARGALRVIERAEVVESVFYRGQGAFVVGRLFSGSHLIPIVLAFVHDEQGVMLDAVLLDEDAVSIIFSFARSYLLVETDRPFDLVRFLRSIMPRKRIAELYIAIGHHKHGKTALYRDLVGHVSASRERFVTAPGKRGMVMEVFTMPGYDVVLKLIKDRFEQPKTVTRRDVLERYALVFAHDRAGRMVDAQTFEHLAFDRQRFDPELLERLLETCGRTVDLEADTVVIRHAFLERRVTPLDLYLRDAAEPDAARAALDYGSAIKDMAESNIFAGDMLLKNFGVTRHGRVVFYDYDEVERVSECAFREKPKPTSYEEMMAAEPWFSVGPHDVFPEEFETFLLGGLPGHVREAFRALHGDLFEVEYWQGVQENLADGQPRFIRPYHPRFQLRSAPQG